MGSVVSGLGNVFTGAGSAPQQSRGYASNEASYAGPISDVAAQQNQYGQQILPTALSQYTAGASGTLTPAQADMVALNLGQAQDRTVNEYANLGLYGSTMQAQDENTNALQSLAETANLEAQSEQLGISGLEAGNQFQQGAATDWASAGGMFGNAAKANTDAGNLAQAQQNDFLQAITNAGKKSG